MSTILTADIHLNERPQDECRWGLFPWLCGQKADELIICGDLTDAKDHHSSKLVNRVYKQVMDLQEHFKVIILKGNHDYYDSQHPFFEFLGNSSDIVYVKEPAVIDLSIDKATFVPAGIKWDFKLHKTPFLFTHATFSGSVAENGQQLTGVDPHVLDDYEGFCYSGDIHVPQRLAKGKITYIGAPYHTRFGDQFTPRLIRLDQTKSGLNEEDLFFPAPRKHVLQIAKPIDLEKEEVAEGDHVKVRCYLHRADYVNWRKYRTEIREIAKDRGWLLFGTEPVTVETNSTRRDDSDEEKEESSYLSPMQLVEQYTKKNRASSDHLRIGKELLG